MRTVGFVYQHQDFIGLIEDWEFFKTDAFLKGHFLFHNRFILARLLLLADDSHGDLLVALGLPVDILVLLKHGKDDVRRCFGQYPLGQCGRGFPGAAILVRRPHSFTRKPGRLAKLSFQIGAVGNSDDLVTFKPLQGPHFANQKHHTEALA